MEELVGAHGFGQARFDTLRIGADVRAELGPEHAARVAFDIGAELDPRLGPARRVRQAIVVEALEVDAVLRAGRGLLEPHLDDFLLVDLLEIAADPLDVVGEAVLVLVAGPNRIGAVGPPEDQEVLGSGELEVVLARGRRGPAGVVLARHQHVRFQFLLLLAGELAPPLHDAVQQPSGAEVARAGRFIPVVQAEDLSDQFLVRAARRRRVLGRKRTPRQAEDRKNEKTDKSFHGFTTFYQSRAEKLQPGCGKPAKAALGAQRLHAEETHGGKPCEYRFIQASATKTPGENH
ncbi:MAG: hypothetical protein HY814_07495 [Candidatus Riflebacteria bacterium]|nr:hypothetical protein [Candidatus Riflebacteria bacterium]